MAKRREHLSELHCFWAHQQAAEGIPLRNPGEAGYPRGARRQRAARKAGSQRSVPLRLRTPVSSAAASAAV